MTRSAGYSSAVSAESFIENRGVFPSFPSLIPLLDLASMLAGEGVAFALPFHQSTRRFETSLVQSTLPASIQVANLARCIELHPIVLKALSRGEHAVIHATGYSLQVRWKGAHLPMPDPCLLVTPILGEQSLLGLICTEFRGVSLTSEAAETIRLLSARAAALIQGGGANPDPSSAPSTYKDALAEIRLRIVSNVTHELRAPLTALRGYTKIVLEERAGPVNPMQREYLGIVLEKAEKLANVMAWSGSLLQRSEEDLLLTSCDLLALWAECVRKNSGSLAAKNLKLQQKLPPGQLSIACDRAKMALALEAILKYAVRSVDHGGSIEIELREGSEKVLFKICHAAGPAVRELLQSVLERREPPNSLPFEDADLTALANARDIINLHGGTASIINNDGTGLGVVFTLPNLVERSV